MKKCKDCKKMKELKEFSFCNRSKGYLTSYCKLCSNIRVKKWIKKNYKHKREYDKLFQRQRRANNPGLKTEEYRKYREKYPEKVKAQQLLNTVVNKGKLKRLPCEVCGKDKTHGHHDDYTKPLNVRWLCPVHHKAIH